MRSFILTLFIFTCTTSWAGPWDLPGNVLESSVESLHLPVGSRVVVKIQAEFRDQFVAGVKVNISGSDFPDILAIKSPRGIVHFFDLQSFPIRVKVLDESVQEEEIASKLDLPSLEKDPRFISVKKLLIPQSRRDLSPTEEEREFSKFLIRNHTEITKIQAGFISANVFPNLAGILIYTTFWDGAYGAVSWRPDIVDHYSSYFLSAIPAGMTAGLQGAWEGRRVRISKLLVVLSAITLTAMHAGIEIPLDGGGPVIGGAPTDVADVKDFYVGALTAAIVNWFPSTYSAFASRIRSRRLLKSIECQRLLIGDES